MTIEYVTVASLKALPDYRLHLVFSNGDEGIRDFSDILEDAGPMISPLRDEAVFRKAFLTYGVPTWPNGLQLDPTNLRLELAERGLLSHPVAAE
ncbi:Protein of unknown function [Devosia crocina]|uniref:DUF2442 domain-containing protein n=1 Tax=Devosia crocina TaxID=429728 RepID=A0A1I7N5Y5_9HYPH|nr:DUF2442 domain-containing protein [Devosia crocina]SFV30065.1 Protein of unknown function [Devosia crocina]